MINALYLLKADSKIILGALQKDFIEGAENTVTLPDIEVQSFNLFARWIYSSGVQCDVAHFMNEDHLQLVKAYILGDRILAPTFQFLLCFTLANTFLGLVDIGWQEIGGEVKTLKVPSIDEVLKAVKIVYAGTSRDGDFLKMVLVSHAAYRMHNGNTCGPHPQAKQWDKSIPTWTPEAVQAMGDSGPQDFLRDVLLEGHNPGCSFEKVSDIYLEYLDS